MDNIKAIFDLTKLPTKFFVLFSFVSGFILFTNDKILQKFYLATLGNKYGHIIGLVFITSFGLVLVNIIIWLFEFIQNVFFIRKLKKEFNVKLKNLDPYEKSVIREFFLTEQSSIQMPIDDPTVAGLLSKKILIINRQIGKGYIMKGTYASISINALARKNLLITDIDLSEIETEADFEFYRLNRPKWLLNR